MRPGECGLACEVCGVDAEHADSVPDARLSGPHPGECGYRLRPLCWVHAVERRQVATGRVAPLLRCETQGLGRLDGGRAGGDVACEACGRLYYDHPRDADFPFMTVLCDGVAVKL